MFAIWLTTEKYFEILKKEEEEDLNICSVCVLFIISNKWFHKNFKEVLYMIFTTTQSENKRHLIYLFDMES